MADSAQASCLKRESGGRNIDAHATDHDWHELPLAEHQTEIIYTHSLYPSTTPHRAAGASRWSQSGIIAHRVLPWRIRTRKVKIMHILLTGDVW